MFFYITKELIFFEKTLVFFDESCIIIYMDIFILVSKSFYQDVTFLN